MSSSLASLLLSTLAVMALPQGVPVCSPEQVHAWDLIWHQALGVDGRDPESDSLVAHPDDEWPPATDGVHDWPLFGDKKTRYCGTLHHGSVFHPAGGLLSLFGIEEHDLTINIIPARPYASLLDEARLRFPNAVVDPCPDEKTPCIHAEITPHSSFPDRTWAWERWLGPLNQRDRPPGQRTELCVYGPLAVDTGHDFHPELHPIQLLWVRPDASAARRVVLMLFQDASARFGERRQFRHNRRPPETWRAWAQGPLAAEFRLAFRADGAEPVKLRVDEAQGRHVKTRSEAVQNPLSFGDPPYVIVTLASSAIKNVEVDVPASDVCLRAPGGPALGFVRLRTMVGGPGCGGEGYQVLTVTEEPGAVSATAATAIAETKLISPPESLFAVAPPTPATTNATVADAEPSKAPIMTLAPPAGEGGEGGGAPAPTRAVAIANRSRATAERLTTTAAETLPEQESVTLLVAVRKENPLKPERMADKTLARAIWKSLLAEAGYSSTATAEPPVPVLAAKAWELQYGPHYGGGQTGERIDEALAAGKLDQAAQQLGVITPFRVRLAHLEAAATRTDDPATAVPFPVRTGTIGAREEWNAGVDVVQTDRERIRVRVVLPRGSRDAVYRVDLRANLSDPAGNEGESRHSVWSHGLDVQAGQGPALVAALEADQSQPEVSGQLAAVHRDLANAAERLSRDGLLTVEELKSLRELARRLTAKVR